MNGKFVSESQVTVEHQILPHQTNNAGKMHGGELLRLLDSAGAICAFRHARGLLVTAAIEHMDFIAPIHPGDIVMFHCSVNAVRRTSMEVGVRIEAEDYLTGEVRHVSTSYMTFVGIDKEGKPRSLPPLIANTDEENRRMADAARRMTISRMMRGEHSGVKQGKNLTELPHTFSFGEVTAEGVLPALPAEKLMGFIRHGASFFCVMKEEDMAVLDQTQFTSLRSGYTCLAFTDALDPASVGVVATISAVLASANVGVFILSTLQTNLVFFSAEHKERAVLALESVGYCISPAQP